MKIVPVDSENTSAKLAATTRIIPRNDFSENAMLLLSPLEYREGIRARPRSGSQGAG
jgi:hypothetical protein